MEEIGEEKKKKLYAASKNKDPILQILKPKVFYLIDLLQNNPQFDDSQINILEIASGTGEHCAYFNENISHPAIHYQCTEPDLSMHESIEAWIAEIQSHQPQPLTTNHLHLPVIPLDIDHWQDEAVQKQIPYSPFSVDVIICINMIHISPWTSTLNLFQFAGNYLRQKDNVKRDAFLITYGPYSINNGEMVESNRAFSLFLKERNSEWGVRDIEDLKVVAQKNGLTLAEIIPMPSNNHCLIFKRS